VTGGEPLNNGDDDDDEMPSFLHNFAGKAQTALNATPIGAHVQQYTNKLTSQGAPSPGGEAQSGQQETAPSSKSYALENVQHQLRVIQQQYRYGLTLIRSFLL
jgi:hypothetical protein